MDIKDMFSSVVITPQAASRFGIGGMPNVPPARTQLFGQRFSPKTGKFDSQEAKSTGFLGPLTNQNGDVVTEYSVSAPVGGRETEFPALVPGLSVDQIRAVLQSSEQDTPVPQDVAAVARLHAIERLRSGLSPFWSASQDAWPR